MFNPCSLATLPSVTASSKNKQITASFRDAGGGEAKPSARKQQKGGGEKGQALTGDRRAAATGGGEPVQAAKQRGHSG